MHADMRPLAPFSEANALLGLLTLTELHLLCLGPSLLGLTVLSLRRLHADDD